MGSTSVLCPDSSILSGSETSIQKMQVIYSALHLPDFVIYMASAHFTDVSFPLW